LAPFAVSLYRPDLARDHFAGVGVRLALLGQAVAAWAGKPPAAGDPQPRRRRIDDIGGVVVSITALLLVAWMIAVPLGSSHLPGFARAVRSSTILGVGRQGHAERRAALYDRLRESIAGSDFPDVFGGSPRPGSRTCRRPTRRWPARAWCARPAGPW
jgi:hypothetical protein